MGKACHTRNYPPMIIGSCQNLMFPHPWGFVGDIYKSSCEVIPIQLEEKNPTQANQTGRNFPIFQIVEWRLLFT